MRLDTIFQLPTSAWDSPKRHLLNLYPTGKNDRHNLSEEYPSQVDNTLTIFVLDSVVIGKCTILGWGKFHVDIISMRIPTLRGKTLMQNVIPKNSQLFIVFGDKIFELRIIESLSENISEVLNVPSICLYDKWIKIEPYFKVLCVKGTNVHL